MAFSPTDWGDFTPAEYEVGAPATSLHFERWFRNVVAAMQGADGAPVNAYAWHPYDMNTIGDGADGAIYDFATDGVQSTVTSPDFEDGFEYRFIFDGQGAAGDVSGGVRLSLYRETSAGYSGPVELAPSALSSRNFGILEMQSMRRALQSHVVVSTVSSVALTTGQGSATAGAFYYTHTTAQKILRARFDFLSADFGSGKIIMQRRLAL